MKNFLTNIYAMPNPKTLTDQQLLWILKNIKYQFAPPPIQKWYKRVEKELNKRKIEYDK